MRSLENNFKGHQCLDHEIFDVISNISMKIDQPIYIVGGYVRDVFLDRPSSDLDLVTVGSGIELAQNIAKELKIKKVTVFKNFGTAMIKIGELELQFVGARKESYRSDTRKPFVEDGSLKDDQLRRDFTINAMAISLNKENYGDLLDPFNGVNDLEANIIRTPLDPEITFSDDPLRMMRAIRFSSQLNFKIESKTLNAIENNAQRINIVSQERITEELNKIILSNYPFKGFKLLDSTGLLKIIFSEFSDLKGIETKNGITHKDNFFHTLEVLKNILPFSIDNLWLRWAVILHDIAKPVTKRFCSENGWTFHGHDDKGARMIPIIFKRLKLPMDHKMKYVQKLVQLHLRPIALTRNEITDSAIRRLLFDASDDLEDLMKLCRADITSKNKEKVKKYLKRFDGVEKKLRDIEKRDHIKNWQPPISGNEIMNTFNLKPSKDVGILKHAIKEAILDGIIENDYNKAFDFMLKKAKEIGIKLNNNK